MAGEKNLLIFGASARAAAFSALRAGLQPWCADLFADRDLQARCPTIRVPGDVYPEGFRLLINRELPGPWMYTGGLENQWKLVDELAQLRPLWGTRESALFLSRTPWFLASLLDKAGLPHPLVGASAGDLSPGKRWLIKPRWGAGGSGIRFWTAAATCAQPGKERYWQEYVEGEPCAAVYVRAGRKVRLLGATRQLVGEPWLRARPFRYCGTIGPLRLDPRLRYELERLGEVLGAGCQLYGLFGIDFILRDGAPWPVEINPRYTASVEILEYAAGVPALALHRQVFDPHTPPAPALPGLPGDTWLGKAILFAKEPLTFPEDGPWMAVLRAPGPLDQPPPFADIPEAGERIEAGRPVLTFFAQGRSFEDCQDRLRQIAADLDSRLYAG